MTPTPLFGLLVGIAVMSVGGLMFAFSRPVANFMHRLFEASVSKGYADAWANRVRVLSTAAGFVAAGLVVVVIALVAFAQGASGT